MITTVFFDLDGTLVDTAPDLAAAVNQLLTEQGQSTLSLDSFRPIVSQGSDAMIKHAFSIEDDAPEFASLRQRFLEHYSQGMHSNTHLFPGIPEVLEVLETNNIIWGVITNKPAWLTQPLMEYLGLDKRAACIISGDTTEYRKPHPAPMQYACGLTKSNPANTLYIGDAKRDIEAGRAAGMHTLIAQYGYICTNDDLEQWHADDIITKPDDIIPWIMSFPHTQ